MRYRADERLEIIRLVEQSSRCPCCAQLAQLGIPRSTFYLGANAIWREAPRALEDGQSAPRRVWNKLPSRSPRQWLSWPKDERQEPIKVVVPEGENSAIFK
jgi:hypothetical protein